MKKKSYSKFEREISKIKDTEEEIHISKKDKIKIYADLYRNKIQPRF